MAQSSSNNKTWAIVIALVFILLAGATYNLGKDDDSKKDSEASSADSTKSIVDVVLEKSGEVDQSAENKFSKDNPYVVNQPVEGDPYEELRNLTGLESVKKEVESLANFVRIQKQREAQGLKVPSITYHCVFTGSPGTGKTTVARLLARIYKDLGVVKKGHLVETDKSGLIAEYVGQTAVKTNAIVDSALNGILFIDEAYAITEEGKGGYGDEAIATLLKRMEDDRDRLVVIVAGYDKEMERFIDSNPGLKSRFTRYIKFPDYKPEELHEIFMQRVEKYNYDITPEAKEYLMQSLTNTVAHKTRTFGNGRYSRNLFEMTITCQANRISKISNPTKEQLSLITIDDIKQAVGQVKE